MSENWIWYKGGEKVEKFSLVCFQNIFLLC